jgi:hypothetical protein
MNTTFSLVVEIGRQPLPYGVVQLFVVLSEHGLFRQVIQDTTSQLNIKFRLGKVL